MTRPDHWYLTEHDDCSFLGEYTARQNFTYSATNSLIANIKKTVDRRGSREWKYKQSAIQEAAEAFRTASGPRAGNALAFVPVPPSKTNDDLLFDDRLTQMLHAIRPHPPLDIRELVAQTESTAAAHHSDVRPSPAQLETLYRLDDAMASSAIAAIAIVDDVLTTGAHFRATKAVLAKDFPDAHIVGLFIARRVPDTSEPDEITFADL